MVGRTQGREERHMGEQCVDRIEGVARRHTVGFREWRNKFKNAFSQAIPGSREVLEELEANVSCLMRDG